MLNEVDRRYLRLLGFEAQPQGLIGLRQLVMRQVCRIPFENVSKLILFGRERRGRLTSASEYLDGIEQSDLGGTCYTANPNFAHLLDVCGYHVDLLAASMSMPNVHTCIRVHLDGTDYHVDVGYASPFRFPIRLTELPLEIAEGSVSYKFRRSDDNGEITVGVYSGRDRIHGYRVHDEPHTPDFFQQTILDSYTPGKTFMTCLRIARFSEHGSIQLRDRTLTVVENGSESQTELKSIAELEEVVRGKLRMPRCPIREAVAVLEDLTAQRFFA